MQDFNPLDALPQFRERIGKIAGAMDEIQYRIQDRRNRAAPRRGQSKLHDTIADALFDQLYVLAEHIRVQIIEALGVLAFGPIGNTAVDALDKVTGKGMEMVSNLAQQVDTVFDGIDRVVDMFETVTGANLVVEKPIKVGTQVMDRIMGMVDKLIGALDRR
jgi:hypothetical protein